MSRRTLPLRSARSGPDSVSAGHDLVVLAGLNEGPDDPCHAGSEGDSHQFHRLALQHLPQPVFSGGLVAARGDLGECAEVEQAAQIAIAHFRDLPQPLFSAAGMRLRREFYECTPLEVGGLPDLIGRHQADACVVMVLVIPGEEAAAERAGFVDGLEVFGEFGLILQRLEASLRERVVIRGMRPAQGI